MVFNRKTNSMLILLFVWVCLMPVQSSAKLIITTQIATGKILNIQDSNIELEDGSLYYPAKPDITLSIHPNDIVTLEFYTDPENKKYYVNFAPGENTLSASPPPARKQKKPLY